MSILRIRGRMGVPTLRGAGTHRGSGTMADVEQLLAFVAVSAVVIVTPGPDTALTLRNALFGGRAAGLASAAGIATGQLCWAIASAVGVAALLIASETLF